MKKTVFFLIICVLFLGCNSSVIFNENEPVNDKGWNYKDKKEFKVTVTDTASKYDFALNVRNTTEYPNDRIYFFIKTIYPDSSVTLRDTIECRLAYDDGSWTGKGSGSIKDNRFFFTKSVTFPMQGQYTFIIEQATRDTNIAGIRNVGIYIKKQEK